MTRLLVVVVSAWMVAATIATAAELPALLIDPYLRVHAMLAADKTDGLKASAAEIATAAVGLGAEAKGVAEAARRLEQAGDVKAARDAFGRMNEALFAYAKAVKATNPAGIATAYCPMVNKQWLQKGETIQNPYYGTEMATCGEIRK